MRAMSSESAPTPPAPSGPPRIDLDALESKLLTLRDEMRLLQARLETLNLFTRLGVRPRLKRDAAG